MTLTPADAPTSGDGPAVDPPTAPPAEEPDPLLEPRPPYGASVSGVLTLVPEARLGVGPRAVPAASVAAWLDELAGRLDLRLGRYRDLLPDEALSRLTSAARTAVHNGAASYLEAARFPERAGRADTSYAAVLWQRYVDTVEELVGWLDAQLALLDEATEEETEADPLVDDPDRAPACSFPPPSFTPALRF